MGPTPIGRDHNLNYNIFNTFLYRKSFFPVHVNRDLQSVERLIGVSPFASVYTPVRCMRVLRKVFSLIL